MDTHSRVIVCTTLDESGSTARKENFDRLEEYLSNFNAGSKFVMESTGFYEPLYDFIESHGFEVKVANPLKIRLSAETRMKNDDMDSEVLAKLLCINWIPESYVPSKEVWGMRRTVRTRTQ